MTVRFVISARHRHVFGVLALFVILGGVGRLAARDLSPAAGATAVAPAEHEEHEPVGWAAWAPTVAKGVNFALLAGFLVYVLKSTVATHLQTRSDTIRKDLVDAASLRATAETQLAAVRARLAFLPAELDALRERGQLELASERTRLADTTAREKQRVLDHTRRDIDLQFRVARRQLVEHSADLAMRRARQKIERDITADDQSRLIDRYATEVRP